MDYVNIIVPFIGGLGMFIYGMQIMAQGLENAAGNRMKSMLEALTRNKFFGVLLGALITAVIQSSSATTVMVVGFVNAGIMSLNQAMGVIMGANIGTTVTGWLVSSVEWAKFLSPGNLAPIAIMLGVVVMLTGTRRSTKDISSIIIGFGLLFVGITTMSASVAPLQDSEGFRNIFITLGHNPFLGIIAGAVVTAVIQSSSASVGILQSLSAAGLVPFNAAVYIIMGQNIGTCVTAIMSSIGAKKTAKTAAVMHLLFNIIGTVLFSIVAIVLFKVVFPTAGTGMITQTEISTVHTIFNIGTTVLLFPVSDLIIKLAKKLEREDDRDQDESRVLLDERMLETPGIALQSVVSEIARMGKIVVRTADRAEQVMFSKDDRQIRKIREEEETVDNLCSGITGYAIQLSSLSLNEKEHQHIASLLQTLSDMERISDYCENISEFAETMTERKAEFSEKGTAELKEMMQVCFDSYRYAVEAFAGNDKEKAMKVIEKESQADELEIQLRSAHMKRLANNQCSTDAGIVYLDALVCLERISDHSRNIAEEILMS
ncbi:MAG: Na/Pi cotransporter family protein [Ruminococcus sp.]|uniref:Na/Pi cotransporter family protein n=1 Tax=Schaedlerella arabinosiphila TaxID=2044587 RepID=A0A3R8KX36_9FIRM|nr:Na/Pi cotransporter family protein [Schaedlerella arabinosiphila]MCI8723223.1 Na/Pi cotransporter family protein [Ruminococcus sp.]MCI9211884.1 Na/Pi cotransporter family protein [Ruminococcus sp.]MCI9604109.1 Na/Pi cotransporter family protein [Ruminococcus sp.]RRK30195.1 Na/Pi cotransporter family protein [Schaedlerella arabinosiphila]